MFDAFGYSITIVGQQPKTLFLFHDHLPDKKIDVNYVYSNEELFGLLAAYLEKVDGQEIDEADLKNWLESISWFSYLSRLALQEALLYTTTGLPVEFLSLNQILLDIFETRPHT